MCCRIETVCISPSGYLIHVPLFFPVNYPLSVIFKSNQSGLYLFTRNTLFGKGKEASIGKGQRLWPPEKKKERISLIHQKAFLREFIERKKKVTVLNTQSRWRDTVQERAENVQKLGVGWKPAGSAGNPEIAIA